MSFLNPVNEPVLRFSSTDASAPQINYNSRTAGDVKAVLKACLVTGYGDTASAGWTTVNEVDNVCEFVSPSAAMSDYRLGIDDSSTSSTTWYYQYQDARINPKYNQPSKSINYIDRTSANNGWQMLVTSRGICFIEIFLHTASNALVTRVVLFGQIKSALPTDSGINMSYICVGYEAQVTRPSEVFKPSPSNFRDYRLGEYSVVDFAATNIISFIAEQKSRGASIIDTISEVFLTNKDTVIAQQPGMLLLDVGQSNDVLGVSDTNISDRPVLSVCVSRSISGDEQVRAYAKRLLFYIDNWEY